ncbi:uncharacterized protein LOC126911759 [Spodoptera frugiperda]|uniref:Uncharacterized protein LOC126911759 n=1 Tax=Spodoptera frugiperda TaxID=7108 RepID=A0A9R0E0E4_SPOFR|nr:uncharacterized protein LOC126911759 [Spodoptera frugiperda]
MTFNPLRPTDVATYYARFKQTGAKDDKNFTLIPFLTVNPGDTRLEPQTIEMVAGSRLNTTTIYFTCRGCKVRGIMWRSFDNKPRNVDNERWRSRRFTDEKGFELSI